MNDDTLTWPLDTHDGRQMIATLRRGPGIERYRARPHYSTRIEVTYTYAPDGMPADALADTLGDITDALDETFHADPVAVITGLYTGAGVRQWIIYTGSPHIFQRKFNEALSRFPQTFPLTFEAYDDPLWQEYADTLAALPTDQ